MDNHIKAFEFIDVERIKCEPCYDTELQDDPLMPSAADLEFIKNEIKDRFSVKLEPIKEEVSDVGTIVEFGEEEVEPDIVQRKNRKADDRGPPHSDIHLLPEENDCQVLSASSTDEQHKAVEVIDLVDTSSNDSNISSDNDTDRLDCDKEFSFQNLTRIVTNNVLVLDSHDELSKPEGEISREIEQYRGGRKACSTTTESFNKKSPIRSNLKSGNDVIDVDDMDEDSCLNSEKCDYVVRILDTEHGEEHLEEGSIAIPGKKQVETYSCEFCNFTSTDFNYLQAHTTVIHKTNKVKKCPLCSEVFEEISSLDSHFKDEHPKNRLFHCESCEHYTIRKGDLKHHMTAVHSGIKPFQCFHCGRFFSRKGDLKIHIINVHLQIKTSKCPHCHKLISPTYLNFHIKSVHLKDQKFNCTQCKYYSYNFSLLKYHIKINHSGYKTEYECSYCHRIFSYKGSLVLHVKALHLNQKDFKCSECSYACVSKKGLREHIQRRHVEGGKPRNFPCNLCSFKAMNRVTLEKHHRVIHSNNDNLFKCSLCDQSFTTKSFRTRHLRIIHSIVENHACKKCDFVTNIYKHLRQHCRTVHKSSRQVYMCKYCQFQSRNKALFKRHMTTDHERILTCYLCGFKAGSEGRRNNHLVTKHNLYPLECHLCNFNATGLGDLYNHLATHQS